jgi:NTP pyrophosphatase (non-canonical NTP hydrolase)
MNDIKEILLILQEECAEVIQAVSKCERFGADNYKPGKPKTNKDHLEEELGDLLAMIELLEEKDFINGSSLQLAKQAKFNKLKQWSNIQID